MTLTTSAPRPAPRATLLLGGMCLCLCLGCGTTKQYEATQQLMASDAVDTAIARIDFTALAGQKVYFDTEYIKNYKGVGFTNAEYVISSLRQQMYAAGLKMQTTREAADFIVEGRVGALGEDDHEVTYGIPASNALSSAASVVSSASGLPAAIPTIPELSIAKRKDQVAAAKVGVFAYDRESGERVWQSGLKVARATSKDLWVLGVGPFQRGTIYDDKLRFAGATLDVPVNNRRPGYNGSIFAYKDEAFFEDLADRDVPPEPAVIQQASAEAAAEETATDEPATEPPAAAPAK